MKLVMLTQYYPPETGAPQVRLSDLARRLVRMGHEVTVLTAMPNYPTGRIHAGYRKKIYAKETLDGVLVHRGWIYACKSRGVIPRLLNYFTFVLSSFVVGALCLRRMDFLLTESPPLFLGVSGYLLSKLKRGKFVLNVADLWPKAAVDMKVVTNGLLIKAAEYLEMFLYRNASLITTQTEGMSLDIRRRSPQKRVRLLTNGADLDRFGPGKAEAAELSEWGLEGRFVAGYAGIHGPAQALEKVVDAGLYLKNFPEIVIALFGDGPIKPELRRRAEEQASGNVRFFPPLPHDRMPGLVASWGAGLVPVYDSPLMSAALPSKMFEIMASEVPVVLSAPRGEASAVIEAAQGGFCVEPESPGALAGAILQLYQDPDLRAKLGRNARAYVACHYNRQTIAEQFFQYLAQLSDQHTQAIRPITA